MTLRTVKAFLPPGSPASAVYASLDAVTEPPFKKLPPVGHQSLRRPRELSPKQKVTFLGTALSRIQAEVTSRDGKWLRRLDTVHRTGSRTHAQRWQALAAIAGPMLARLDLATGCLGYLDAGGQFHLNRQNGIAEDGDITPSRLSRLFHSMELAAYLRRKVKRLYQNGKRWICRVTIFVRPRFFIDLGLGFQYAAARSAKVKARAKALRAAASRDQQAHLQDIADATARRDSHRKAEGAREASREAARMNATLERNRLKAAELSRLATDNPGLSVSDIRALYDHLHPPA